MIEILYRNNKNSISKSKKVMVIFFMNRINLLNQLGFGGKTLV